MLAVLCRDVPCVCTLLKVQLGLKYVAALYVGLAKFDKKRHAKITQSQSMPEHVNHRHLSLLECVVVRTSIQGTAPSTNPMKAKTLLAQPIAKCSYSGRANMTKAKLSKYRNITLAFNALSPFLLP